MVPGKRTHRQATLLVAIATSLPEDMQAKTRELVALQSVNQARGEASGLMRKVCAEADQARIALIVKPEPFAPGLAMESLKRFYAKRGFVEFQAEPCLMARMPEPTRKAANG